MNVLRAYRSLNAEQKRILRDKRVDLNRPVDELLALLRPLAQCDTLADKARKSLGCSAGAALLGVVLALIVFSNTGWGAVAVTVFAALVVAMCAFFFFWRWTRGIDVSNNFRAFAIPVLTVLREDFASNEPVHVSLDLSAPTQKAKLQSESAPYKKGVYHKVVDRIYVDPWMRAEGVLVDGTKLSWNVTDRIRERRKTKRNARGKYKMKTKIAKKSYLGVEVGLRNKRYAVQNVPANAELHSDEKRTRVRVEREVRSMSLDPIEPRALIDLVADVYGRTKPAKEAGA